LLVLSVLLGEGAGGEGRAPVCDALIDSVCDIVEETVDESEAEDVDEVVGEVLEGG
jgi:hypothetical protein